MFFFLYIVAATMSPIAKIRDAIVRSYDLIAFSITGISWQAKSEPQ